MNQQEIQWLSAQDPTKMNGNLQVTLASKELPNTPFDMVLQYLLTVSYAEHKILSEENKKLSDVLKRHNLYNAKELF